MTKYGLLLLVAGCAGAPLRPTLPTVTGDAHDFDSLHGAWKTQQRRLKHRGVGSQEWYDFAATVCQAPLLDGMVNVGEVLAPSQGILGFTLRTFDPKQRQWSIYWVNSKNGLLQPPVLGGFAGNRGEFYGADEDEGRPIVGRYVWSKLDADHARWEQAFSYDGQKTWEVNWTADFERADASICDGAHVRRP
jgi:hypothetical protein